MAYNPYPILKNGNKDIIVATAFSKDLREKIVSAYHNGIGTIVEVAEIFGITARTVSKYLALDRKSGDLTPGKSPGRPAILTDRNLSIIKDIILATPSGTLFNYCDAFEKETGIVISKSSMGNACHILNLRRKKKFFRK